MLRNKLLLITALLFPILVLLVQVGARQYERSAGYEIILPISGYDPRDLLSGHYLIYQVDYGIDDICRPYSKKYETYICLENHTVNNDVPPHCKLFIRGVCDSNRFFAGIERFYIPEKDAAELDKRIRDKKASILITVMPNGQAQVKDLLLNEHSWKSPSNKSPSNKSPSNKSPSNKSPSNK